MATPYIGFEDAFGDELPAPKGTATFSQTLPQGWDSGINASIEEERKNEAEKSLRIDRESADIFDTFNNEWNTANSAFSQLVARGDDPAEAAAMTIQPLTMKWAAFSPLMRQMNAQKPRDPADDWETVGGQGTGLWRVNKRTGEKQQIQGPATPAKRFTFQQDAYGNRYANDPTTGQSKRIQTGQPSVDPVTKQKTAVIAATLKAGDAAYFGGRMRAIQRESWPAERDRLMKQLEDATPIIQPFDSEMMPAPSGGTDMDEEQDLSATAFDENPFTQSAPTNQPPSGRFQVRRVIR